ncbi:acetyl-CoA hydrolase/transferase C-terminal domain-containing protein [Haloarculaceae archaeon H-GB2-1]|nr:acetyl-CoA hydrolase/transferase C-terminal domain-containing protein [Haloarculaceae archaeon H-GB1-1]MEA5389421.1 acetyl-CoA hydrolase/transferase C-terminal domain-containing protein [Haloarculaceae archaeon H-GB11]MEA5409781.1 acetyl-CoA hydrolase/transferase C-terminal domain-containing protein [Haloarculaceae archaeon H-GB2-1]
MTDRLVGDLPVRDAESVAADVPTDADLVVSGFGSVGYPKATPVALADSERDLELTVVSGGSVGAEIDVELVEANAIARRFPYQARPPAREAVNDGSIEFHDRNISTLGDEVEFGHLVDADIAIVEALAVGPDWLVPTSSIGQTPAFVAGADELVVELNHSVPESVREFHDIYRVGLPPNRGPIPLTDPGDRIADDHITFDPEKLTAVIETERRDQPYEFRDPTPDDRGIAANLVDFLESEVEGSPLFEDSLRIQFGVGSLGNALMGALGDADFGDRDLVYFGEVIQDGLLDLLDDGELDSASATSLALSRDGQDRLYEHADRYAEDIVLRPADVSNNPALIDRFGVVAVNSALEVDLFGHVNSTHVTGNYMMNGVGGSADFNRNAAIVVLALPSTAASGDLSRVVPMVPHTDHTEHDIDIVITEQGVTDLRGNSPRETAESLIENCAHPDFRDGLREYLDRGLDRGGHIPHHLETAFDWHIDR